jgi:hypothetical protein
MLTLSINRFLDQSEAGIYLKITLKVGWELIFFKYFKEEHDNFITSGCHGIEGKEKTLARI